MAIKFPDGFVWGAATSAHQVEGGNINSWSVWETEQAERLAAEAESKYGSLPIWESIKADAQNPDNYKSGQAVQHFERYDEDFALAAQIGIQAYRFSIEWSRIEPEEGKFNEAAIEHYREMIMDLRRRGIEPFVTLWHWPLPLWVADKGGWERASTGSLFVRYAERMATEFSDIVVYWITLNEPEGYAIHSYLNGTWPPQKKNIFTCFGVQNNLIAAHKQAYTAMKAINQRFEIGIAKNNTIFEPANHWPWTLAATKVLTWLFHDYFPRRINKSQDFFGLNYYTRELVGRNTRIKTGMRTDLGWEIYPRGIYRVLMDVRKYGKPIYITESGLADEMDQHRKDYLIHTLEYVAQAIADGADVRGYFHWSLLDNFEWDKGFWPKFGLIAVDRATGKRTLRPSAEEYGRIIAGNEID
jgi:beta-glucosidase